MVRLAWSSIVAVDVEEGYMRICGNVASEDKIVFTLLDRSDGMEFTWRLGQSTQMERRGGWGWGGAAADSRTTNVVDRNVCGGSGSVSIRCHPVQPVLVIDIRSSSDGFTSFCVATSV